LSALALVSCAQDPVDAPATPAPAPTPTAAPWVAHTPLDGHAFPDKVIALTWDDGPDANTLALASYLRSHHVSATFFVVSSWARGLSDDPGSGKGVFESGYDYLPILGDLVGLGHRLGNHTLHHVILREGAGASVIDRELRENQHNLDRYLVNELRLFRAPGGGWGSFAQNIVDHDPYLGRMVGPIHWDIDKKDWDESLDCKGPRSAAECEHAAPGSALRMKPSVVAARYVASIESAAHGIVLLHDRVGHVGSTYGLEIAKAMIPQLEARGFVFAAPVLRFSPLVVRYAEAEWEPSSVRLVDIDGDGRADLCGASPSGTTCAISVQSTSKSGDGLPKTIFHAARAHAMPASDDGDRHSGDLNGDGLRDTCTRTSEGIACALATGGGFARSTIWLSEPLVDFQLGDINGDGRADLCGATPDGIACALAP
jgi:peptidoglycan/xylan/chitin deacetylase (PgdA/CDA1 family)